MTFVSRLFWLIAFAVGLYCLGLSWVEGQTPRTQGLLGVAFVCAAIGLRADFIRWRRR